MEKENKKISKGLLSLKFGIANVITFIICLAIFLILFWRIGFLLAVIITFCITTCLIYAIGSKTIYGSIKKIDKKEFCDQKDEIGKKIKTILKIFIIINLIVFIIVLLINLKLSYIKRYDSRLHVSDDKYFNDYCIELISSKNEIPKYEVEYTKNEYLGADIVSFREIILFFTVCNIISYSMILIGNKEKIGKTAIKYEKDIGKLEDTLK